ncbi:DNA-binding response OmpR family regulator [Clostridium beijerinckii]|nr:DNA-binding response OmpR family regulator [Clostridium beijerinckii]
MKGKRILVVDDEPLIRKLVTDFLKKTRICNN